MSYGGTAVVFAAIGFVLTSALFSALTGLAWRIAGRSLRRPGALFLMRMTPSLASAAVVAGLVVPGYLAFEPKAAGEAATAGLIACVAVAAGLVLGGACRWGASWVAMMRLERNWRRVAEPSVCPGFPGAAYRVPSDLPFAALVGVVRPRLFVADRFFDALTLDERRAVVRHEAGHLHARDNLKRAAMRLAPDWLALGSTGREIEAAWAIASEEAADDHAAGSDAVEGLAVAAALLKASRLMPVRLATVSNFCDGATIARRVARLLDDPPRRGSRSWIPAAGSMVGLIAVAVGLARPAAVFAYGLTESIVRWLQ